MIECGAPASRRPLAGNLVQDPCVNGFRISTDLADMDFALIHDAISQSYWAKGIPASTCAKALEHSLCFGVFDAGGAQVGFARVITDTATFAYLCDVFILDAYRGRGLGRWLLQTLLDHPSVQGLRRFLLATRDAHGLYARFGFTELAEPQIFMSVHNPDIYTRA